jgi:hypothetical protein
MSMKTAIKMPPNLANVFDDLRTMSRVEISSVSSASHMQNRHPTLAHKLDFV